MNNVFFPNKSVPNDCYGFVITVVLKLNEGMCSDINVSRLDSSSDPTPKMALLVVFLIAFASVNVFVHIICISFI